MKNSIRIVIGMAVVVLGAAFIFNSFKKASPPPDVAPAPEIGKEPVRVYGMTEPAGREVFVSPPMTKRVVQVYVREGDEVRQGQRLCDMENSVEREQVELAQARVALAQKSLELKIDDLKRTKRLYKNRIDSEYKYTQAEIQKKVELKRLKVADHELEVAKAQLEQTILRSPINGIVYKMDVRLGETLNAGDNTRIVLGETGLWVRLFVESYWKDSVTVGSACRICDTETGEFIGSGTIIKKMPYMGRRDFRTEDLTERFDTKFQEVIVELKPEKNDIPIGLSVVAEMGGSD